MPIVYSPQSGEFHLYNRQMSCVLRILDNGQLANAYIGRVIRRREGFSRLLPGGSRPLAVCTDERATLSLQYTRLEYPCAGTGDFREPALAVRQENGSRIVCLRYASYRVYDGKPPLAGLPATYTEHSREAQTLELTLEDALLGLRCTLLYTIFADLPVIARSVRVENAGAQTLTLERALSLSLDLPDMDYEMLSLTGAWARERHIRTRRLEHGLQRTGSTRGASSAEFNPFLCLKRPETTETTGEAWGFSLIYSGNHLEQADVDTDGGTRVQLGIHPDGFSWQLAPGERFQCPEAVLVFSGEGLGGMSRAFHTLYRTRLARGVWRDRERPILINNWEATGPDFTEEQIVAMARTAKTLGIELLVLDDGWFGARDSDRAGLGDWYVKNFQKLPHGLEGLAERVRAEGLQFGFWIEPEMVNRDSDLFRAHPDWILCPPDRTPSPGRNQYVLDLSRPEIVDHLYAALERVLNATKATYVKWDMNRYISECWSRTTPGDRQGEVLHRYILGVYRLYERLRTRFPDVLFESCASGGARFDPGILFYAPQAWTSDDTDAVERVKIQYGTSLVYPLSMMGAHVSAVPNQQTGRVTPLLTRGNAAMFGVFGYELDLTRLTEGEKQTIREQIAFYKRHRALILTGDFYRLQSPFSGADCAWMLVSRDKREALIGYYRTAVTPNVPPRRVRLCGLDAEKDYRMDGDAHVYGGDELMYAGLIICDDRLCTGGDYSSAVWYLCERK